MAINVPGAIFRDKKGVEYILKYGPKGNLRPYTVKLLQNIMPKVPKNPYVITTVVIAATVIGVTLLLWSKSKKNDSSASSNI
jgi:hypothetical protein